MSEVEYPRWVYPPDGGPGCIVQTPDERPKGWLDAPTKPGPQTGERIIGQPTTFTTQSAGLTADELTEVETLERKVQADEADEDSARKSKKK